MLYPADACGTCETIAHQWLTRNWVCAGLQRPPYHLHSRRLCGEASRRTMSRLLRTFEPMIVTDTVSEACIGPYNS